MRATDDKWELVNKATDTLEKDFGKGVVFRGSDSPLKIDAIPTGSIALDRAIGIGGVPRGRVTIIVGRESTGKTTLVKHIIAEGQALGEICAFVDAEHTFDRTYATTIGVDVDELLISQPDDGEQALEVCEGLARSGGIGLIVLDSVAALVPRAELEAGMDEQQMGLQARLMSKFFRKVVGPVMKANVALIATNQLREKIGGYSPTGQPVEVQPGGRAMKFYPSVIMDMRKIEDIKDGRELVGIRTRVKLAKNKTAPPFKEAILDVMYGEGISKAGAILDVGVDMAVIRKAGAWLYFADLKWNGRAEALLYLRQHLDVMAEIEMRIREEM